MRFIEKDGNKLQTEHDSVTISILHTRKKDLKIEKLEHVTVYDFKHGLIYEHSDGTIHVIIA